VQFCIANGVGQPNTNRVCEVGSDSGQGAPVWRPPMRKGEGTQTTIPSRFPCPSPDAEWRKATRKTHSAIEGGRDVVRIEDRVKSTSMSIGTSVWMFGRQWLSLNV
jgi:hypothetical protein